MRALAVVAHHARRLRARAVLGTKRARDGAEGPGQPHHVMMLAVDPPAAAPAAPGTTPAAPAEGAHHGARAWGRGEGAVVGVGIGLCVEVSLGVRLRLCLCLCLGLGLGGGDRTWRDTRVPI
jgi:hypothetical protein